MEGIEELDKLRDKIDDVDRDIVERLNERARIVLAIKKIKEDEKLPLYDPGREEKIFSKITGINAGPLYDDSLREIYERILHVMKSFD